MCQSIIEKAMVVGYVRMLRRALRRPQDVESPARIARSKEMLAILLEKRTRCAFNLNDGNYGKQRSIFDAEQ